MKGAAVTTFVPRLGVQRLHLGPPCRQHGSSLPTLCVASVRSNHRQPPAACPRLFGNPAARVPPCSCPAFCSGATDYACSVHMAWPALLLTLLPAGAATLFSNCSSTPSSLPTSSPSIEMGCCHPAAAAATAHRPLSAAAPAPRLAAPLAASASQPPHSPPAACHRSFAAMRGVAMEGVGAC